MLDKFILAKQEEIELLKKLDRNGLFPEPYKEEKKRFKDALSIKKGIIAEYKRGSPSLGIINDKLSVKECVFGYEESGAIGVSILTEEKYFFSSVEFLNKLNGIKIPVLRKDFIIHPLQVRYTAATCASGILIIVKLFEKRHDDLMYLIEYSKIMKLEPIVEVNNISELQVAKECGAEFILVNNRDLDTLNIDLNTSKKLIKHKKNNEIWISASGLSKIEDIKNMLFIGYDACLIGTYLMKQPDPMAALREITSSLDEKYIAKRKYNNAY